MPSQAHQLFQVMRFVMVGAVNTVTFYSSYLALHTWLSYVLAYTAAFTLSMVGSFFLNTYFTYRTRPSWRKFLTFPLTNLTNFVLTGTGTILLVHWLHVSSRLASLPAAVAAIPITFLVSRRILLPGNERPASGQSDRRSF